MIARGEVEPPDEFVMDDPEVCAGCGDKAEFWVGGGWYCYGCASCDICDSPYCNDPEHR
jgi:hypothetical protein